MAKQDDVGKKLDEKLTEIGFPAERRGDARDRGEFLGTTAGGVRQWITNRHAPPLSVRIAIKLYSLLTAEAREEFRRWLRERHKSDDWWDVD
ncbi:MAG: hypothetical protein ACR2RE_01570 [Geminicoccaceae bacterium]